MVFATLSELLQENGLMLPADILEAPYISASGRRLVLKSILDNLSDWDESRWNNPLLGADIDTYREKLEESLQFRFLRPIYVMNGPIYLEKPTLDAFNPLHVRLSHLTNPDFMEDFPIFKSGEFIIGSVLQKMDGYFMLKPCLLIDKLGTRLSLLHL